MKRILILSTFIATVLASCSRFDAVDRVFENSLYLDVSMTGQVQPASFGNKLPEVTKDFAVNMAYPSDKDITATVFVDESLVSEYNSRYGTSYGLIPSEYLDFKKKTITLKAGETVSERIVLTLKGLMGEGENNEGAMEVDRTWLLPIRLISDDMDTMESCSVAYYLVKRSSGITVALDLTDNFIRFPELDMPGPLADVYNNLTAVTYEALIYIDKFDTVVKTGANVKTVDISTVMGVESGLLLRIGDARFEREQLQFDGSGAYAKFGKLPKRDPSKKLSTGQWYHVACTYSQEDRLVRIYLDGKIQSEQSDVGVLVSNEENRIRLAQRGIAGSDGKERQFLVGFSYDQYRPLQGKIAEIRVWSEARTSEQIWENMYHIDSPETLDALIGYWKCDDMEGDTVHDYSKYGNHGKVGYDGVPNAINQGLTLNYSPLKWVTGIEIQEINKEE